MTGLVSLQRDFSRLFEVVESSIRKEELTESLHQWACDCVSSEVKKLSRYPRVLLKGMETKMAWVRGEIRDYMLSSAEWEVRRYYNQSMRRVLVAEYGPDSLDVLRRKFSMYPSELFIEKFVNVSAKRLKDLQRREKVGRGALQAMHSSLNIASTAPFFLPGERQEYLFKLEGFFDHLPGMSDAVQQFIAETDEVLFF